MIFGSVERDPETAAHRGPYDITISVAGPKQTLVDALGGKRLVLCASTGNTAASLAAYASIVWIAGGQLKGADVDELVRRAAPRLRGAVKRPRR